MDNLRLVLIVLGGVAILGLLLHGLYVMRKNNTPREQLGNGDDGKSPPSTDFSKPQRVEPQLDAQGFDEFGVGTARVVTTQSVPENTDVGTQAEENPSLDSDNIDTDLSDNVQDEHWDEIPTISSLEEVPNAPDNLPINDDGPQYAPAVSNPKPAEHYQNKVKASEPSVEPDITITPPPAEFVQAESSHNQTGSPLEPSDNELGASPSSSSNEPESPIQKTVTNVPAVTKDAPQKSQTKSKASLASMLFGSRTKVGKKKQKVDENQFSIDFDSVDPVLNEAKEQARSEQSDITQEPKYDPNIPPEVLCISVKAQPEQYITGARLLPLLLTLGLKFGDSDIFHRHVNNNGKGPVLFSLANMFKPGVFDIHHMETFETKGVTLFMTLPMESDAHQVFNMMHNAARKIADEFDARLLDEARQELTVSGLPQYVERIRDFEKRRLLG